MAIKVVEEEKKGAKAPSMMRGLVAGAIIAAVGVAALFVLAPEEEPAPETPKAPKPVKTETRTWVTNGGEPVKKVVEPKEPTEEQLAEERLQKIKAMTPKERMEFFLEEAKNRPIDLYPTTNNVFNTGTEQVMSWIFTTKIGDPPPPMPKMSVMDEAHLAEILVASNPTFETDSEKVADAKAAVEWAKKELIEYIGQGGDAKDFLEYYRGELVQAHNEWKEAQRNVMTILEEDPDIAADYIAEVNAQLAEKGIKGVIIPPAYKEQLGLD